MAPIGSLLRAAMQRLAQDPNFRKYVTTTATRIRQSPHVVKAEKDMRSAALRIKNRFTPSSATKPHQNAAGSGSSSSQQQQQQKVGTPFQRAQFFWGRNKEKVIAFISVNFMGILFALQFGQQIWHFLVAYFSSSSKPKHIQQKQNQIQQNNNNNTNTNNNLNKSEERQRKRKEKAAAAAAAVGVGAAAAGSGAGFLDLSVDGGDTNSYHNSHSNNSKDDYAQQFAESFQFKLDGGEFLSSLESHGITGAAAPRASSSWFGSSTTPQTTEMVFDLRR